VEHDNETEEANMIQLLMSPWPVIIGYALAAVLVICMVRDIAREVRGE
jgi:hypothetical protein